MLLNRSRFKLALLFVEVSVHHYPVQVCKSAGQANTYKSVFGDIQVESFSVILSSLFLKTKIIEIKY